MIKEFFQKILNFFSSFVSLIINTWYLNPKGKKNDNKYQVILILMFNLLIMINQITTLTTLIVIAINAFFIVYIYKIDSTTKNFEYYIVLLAIFIANIALVQENNLLNIFLALEIQSICIYSLMGTIGSSKLSLEAAIKYYFAAALGTICFLYSSSILYTNYVTLNITEMSLVLCVCDLALSLSFFLLILFYG